MHINVGGSGEQWTHLWAGLSANVRCISCQVNSKIWTWGDDGSSKIKQN